MNRIAEAHAIARIIPACYTREHKRTLALIVLSKLRETYAA